MSTPTQDAISRSLVAFVAALVSIVLTAIGLEDLFDVGEIDQLAMAIVPAVAFVANLVYRTVVPENGGRSVVTFLAGLFSMVVVAVGLGEFVSVVQIEALAVAVVPVVMFVVNWVYRQVVPADPAPDPEPAV